MILTYSIIWGAIIWKKENYDKAIEKFNACLKIENNRHAADATLGLSIAYFKKNDYQNAKKYLDLAQN
ncbi:MAG: tetratricopeptide repeat protein [Saprospirales bacterium]|nr:tetratricopeptide repeat protein [Saprospirales bacterium]